jgi:glycosyltransferase involved in cell wall biosynthesis
VTGGQTTRVKVVRFVTRLNVGGVAHHIIALMRGLDEIKYQQQLVCGVEPRGEKSMRQYFRGQAAGPILIPGLVGNPRLNASDVRAFACILNLLREQRPLIVHTHTSKVGLLGRVAARLAGVPIVLHTFHGLVLKDHYGPVKSRVARAVERWLGRISDRLIVICEENRKDLVRYRVATSDKIELIPLGIELHGFVASDVQHGALHAELGLDPAAKLIGIVGRIAPVKNHRLFLDAAARLFARQPYAYAVVVGDGELRPETERYAHHLGIHRRVYFLGWRHDLPQVYADLDAVVISSNNEGTPVAAIEAMAAGRAVVATRVGGLPDVISNGKTGYLVEPGSAEQLALAIERVLKGGDAICELRRNARDAVIDRFNFARLVSDIDSLYQRLLAEKGL